MISIIAMEGENKKSKKNVKFSDFTIETPLGIGSFGRVKLARRKRDGAVLCVKTMKKAEIIEAKQIDHIINECQIISQLNHPMIVRMYSFRFLFMVLPKTQSYSTFSWSMLEEESSLLISERRECLTQ